MIKKGYFLLLFLLLTQLLLAQSPLLDQWFLNNYLINPAITGIERFMDVQLGSRYQWTGVDGAPTSHFISAHSPIGNIRSKKGFTKTPSPSSPDEYSYQKFKFEPHHGIGGIIYIDQIGPFTNFELNGSYALHLALNQSLFLSTGFSLGFIRRYLNMNAISTSLQADPAIANFNPDMSLSVRPGIWLYGDRFYLGGSVSEFIDSEDQKELRSSILTAGYRFDSKAESLHITPYGLLRLNSIKKHYDIGLKIDWKRQVYIGGTYRSTNETVLYLGSSINYFLGFTYLFNVGPRSTFTNGSGGTHEIQLSFRFKNKEKISCPQKMW